MKHKDVKIGATYLTRIGMNLCPVVVVSEYVGTSRKGFHVRRVGSDTILPKKRTAAGLREVIILRTKMRKNMDGSK